MLNLFKYKSPDKYILIRYQIISVSHLASLFLSGRVFCPSLHSEDTVRRALSSCILNNVDNQCLRNKNDQKALLTWMKDVSSWSPQSSSSSVSESPQQRQQLVSSSMVILWPFRCKWHLSPNLFLSKSREEGCNWTGWLVYRSLKQSYLHIIILLTL